MAQRCGKKATGRLCGTCRARQWRIKNPLKYAYNNLKNRCKQRGKPFELTLGDFEKFCVKTLYLAGKGRCANGLTIDRKNPKKGYTKDNIQTLTLSNNVKKQFLEYDWLTKHATVTEKHWAQIDEKDLPF